MSFWVGNLALAVILLDGGLRTAFATFRSGLKPASVLASAGVAISAGITALAGVVFAGLDIWTALLLGAVVGSTDAAAVFALLTRSGVTLNERVAATLEIESGVNDPMAVFLLLGLLVTPTTMLESVGPGLGVAATLMFIARPAAVWLCLLPFRFSARETWFISRVGLRGAVPIVLALFPLMAGTPQAGLLFNIAFMVVLASLLIQGSTIGLVAHKLPIGIGLGS